MLNIVLYQPEISPNTGNIIRTCFAIGAKLHIIRPIAFDLEPKWLKRPAAGKRLSDIRHEVHNNYEEFEKKYGNKKIFYITRYGQQTYADINFKKEKEFQNDIFLMFGTESTGIPKQIMQKDLNACLRIPMVKENRSINLANSVVLVAYEVMRQLNFENLSLYEVQKGKDFIKNDH
ncbi:tRNA (cytidine(34)-2'-O)-methyltransferase [Mesomycoplasma lagogenitalium]|uniref:Putative tRNA (cytidine(34)-2'-O)-methyltransferase n=1 Tax=Mesomycoplasma lagogenitalium TaxID=171286 RepID=A0ABY8LSN0_9BACT|nr:tRNA (cytidine(34)-2'-O)-methyltransferase [Mesomycoplasma lagogenitalium]WGI36260.1 tRNA (cytidine(34)-2'-O)-methyltransferase [Mesomycoplasma lagogenitalium]